MWFKLFNGLFLIAFLASAAVQFNDPDALRWMVVYIAAAGMCIDQLLYRRLAWLPVLLLVLAVGWGALLLPNILGRVTLEEIVASISMQTTAVEEAREIGGLLLVALWSAVVLLRGAAARRIKTERSAAP